MKIAQTERDGGVLVVRLDGDLDIAGAGAAELPLGVVAGARDKVVLDMRGVGFLASIGVRVLVATAKPILRRGGRLVLVGPNAAAQRVLSSTGVDTLVTIVADEEAALAALA